MTDRIWVKNKQTGHEYPIAEGQFNEDAHVKTGESVKDEFGMPRPPKYATPSGSANRGQKKAETPKKEKD